DHTVIPLGAILISGAVQRRYFLLNETGVLINNGIDQLGREILKARQFQHTRQISQHCQSKADVLGGYTIRHEHSYTETKRTDTASSPLGIYALKKACWKKIQQADRRLERFFQLRHRFEQVCNQTVVGHT